ncbi:ATP-binding protein [Peptacetobacter sp.]|uniref:ATP-binding protein n=1 Tax=Peptacetobacter sp. TaxID=2991975 RepID=UPI0026374BF8|nr:sensor histidine kinase [Peptacetobacter sp.]
MKNKREFAYSNLLLILVIVIESIFSKDLFLRLFINILFVSMNIRYNYNIRLQRLFFIIFIYSLFIIVIDSLVTIFLMKVQNIERINLLFNNYIYFIQYFVVTKVILVLSLLKIKKERWKFVFDLEKEEYLKFLLPVIVNIVSIVIIFEFLMTNTIKYNSNFITILILIISAIISNIAIIKMIIRILKNNKLDYENKLIKEKLNMQYQYYNSMQKNYSKVREIYHDMNNHIMCIEKLNSMDRKKYINEIKEKLEDVKNNFHTNNLILDIILMEKEEICKEYNINLYVDLNLKKCDFIEMTDICTIFSNLLDNAIEASKNIEDEENKKIFIKDTIVNKFYLIKIENNKKNIIIKKENRIITSKKDDFLHGLGLQSVRNAVEKYNGNMDINDSENVFEIIIYIPLVQISNNNTQIGKIY